MSLFYLFIYLYLLLRPYYFFSSGSLQISDCFLILAFLVFMLVSVKNQKIFFNEVKKNWLYLFFLFLVIVINIIYFVLYGTRDFIVYTSYYIFNFIVIILFSFLVKNDKFLKNMNKIMKINLLIQLLICILGLGNMYGDYRYMGTFNDPNQFGYFILITYCFIYLFNFKYKNNVFLYLIISFYLIFESVSTGMLLALSIFVVIEIFNILKVLPNFIKKYSKKLFFTSYYIFACFVVLFSVCTFNPDFSDKISLKLSNIKIVNRVKEKLDKTDAEHGNLFQERGYDRIYFYPKYVLFGAGEGNFHRWSLAYQQGELHATLPSILFNYGIIPLVLICCWIYSKIKGKPLTVLVVHISLLLESFTLLNSRQALFWIIFIVADGMFVNNCLRGETGEEN